MLSKKPTGMLWHYTTGEKLVSMLESRALWATHLSCLNDSQEYTFSARLCIREGVAA